MHRRKQGCERRKSRISDVERFKGEQVRDVAYLIGVSAGKGSQGREKRFNRGSAERRRGGR